MYRSNVLTPSNETTREENQKTSEKIGCSHRSLPGAYSTTDIKTRLSLAREPVSDDPASSRSELVQETLVGAKSSDFLFCH